MTRRKQAVAVAGALALVCTFGSTAFAGSGGAGGDGATGLPANHPGRPGNPGVTISRHIDGKDGRTGRVRIRRYLQLRRADVR